MPLTRRTFARQLAGVSLSPFLPRLADPNQRKIGYCMVGLGRISLQHFMPGCRQSQSSRVTALVSGHRDKAEKYAAEYNIPAKNIYSYDNYDQIAQNPD